MQSVNMSDSESKVVVEKSGGEVSEDAVASPPDNLLKAEEKTAEVVSKKHLKIQ